MFLEYWVFFTK